MNFVLRAVVLTLCLAPYVYFGIRDLLHHANHRSVGFTERLLHLTLGTTLIIFVPQAYLGHFEVVIPGIILFTTARALDEFVFHRGLAKAEVELHSKTHFGFLVFVAGIVGTNWLQRVS